MKEMSTYCSKYWHWMCSHIVCLVSDICVLEVTFHYCYFLVFTALKLSCKDAHPTKLLKQASLTLLRTLAICCGISADHVQTSSARIFCSLLRDIIQVNKLYWHEKFNDQPFYPSDVHRI